MCSDGIAMPELPEVEAARRLLEAHCVGKKVAEVHAQESGGHARDGQFDNIVFDDAEISEETVTAALAGKTLEAVHRKGKQLWLELSSPLHLLAHFGMTGAFVIEGVRPLEYQEFKVHDEAWPPRFTKLELVFRGASASAPTRLAFCDPRRLGRLRLRADPLTQEPWSALAPDPLLEPVSVARCVAALGAKGCTIKSLLLDQAALVSGVGNWVADEVLFHAAIHPEATCHSLSVRQVEALHAALLMVVNVATGANAAAAAFPEDWLFHYRWGKGGGGGARVPGPHGGPITFLTVGGRTSAVVLSRQRKGEGRAQPSTGDDGGASAAASGTAAAGKRRRAEPAAGKSKAKATSAKGPKAKGSGTTAEDPMVIPDDGEEAPEESAAPARRKGKRAARSGK